MRAKPFKVGDRVKYAAAFLRSTGMYTGDIPRARGTITALEAFGTSTLAVIDWGNPEIPTRVITANLKHEKQAEV